MRAAVRTGDCGVPPRNLWMSLWPGGAQPRLSAVPPDMFSVRMRGLGIPLDNCSKDVVPLLR